MCLGLLIFCVSLSDVMNEDLVVHQVIVILAEFIDQGLNPERRFFHDFNIGLLEGAWRMFYSVRGSRELVTPTLPLNRFIVSRCILEF